MLLLLTLMKIKTERTRVLSGSIDNAIIYLRNLWKIPRSNTLSLGRCKPLYLTMGSRIHVDRLPYGQGLSLADVLGHLERNGSKLGIAEYSIQPFCS
ncbi:hypothetical protein ACFX2I_014314 [Malus domestica]